MRRGELRCGHEDVDAKSSMGPGSKSELAGSKSVLEERSKSEQAGSSSGLAGNSSTDHNSCCCGDRTSSNACEAEGSTTWLAGSKSVRAGSKSEQAGSRLELAGSSWIASCSNQKCRHQRSSQRR